MLVRIDERGRITLPKKFRERLKIKNGDYLMLDIEDGLLVGNPVVPIKRPRKISSTGVKEKTYTEEELLEHIKNLAGVPEKR